MGLPVVGTTSATQGVEGEIGRDFLLANSVDEQVAAIARLLDEPLFARKLGAQGRAFVESRYDWDVALRPLDELLARFSSR
jgi:glycosyltransferase involved in cell wall biosynthesis